MFIQYIYILLALVTVSCCCVCRGSLFSRCLPQDIIDNPLNAVGLFTNSTVLSTFTQFFSQYRFFNELAASFYTVRYDILYLMLIALGE